MNAPFLRLVIPLVLGIWAYDSLDHFIGIEFRPLSYFFPAALILGSAGIAFAANRAKRTLALACTVLFLGAWSAHRKHTIFLSQIEQVGAESYTSYVLEIKSLGQKRKASTQYEAQLSLLDSSGIWIKKNAGVLLSIGEGSAESLTVGDRVLVKNNSLQRPGLPLNPNEFDYRKYLARRGIAWRVYLRSGDFVRLKSAETFPISRWPASLSDWADSKFKNLLPSSSSYGLVKAMLLGRRDDLGADLLQSYIAAGAVHVLAVSGLHVGILFLLLSRILAGLKKKKWGEYLFILLILIFLVTYSLITGMSPSVVRASLMCMAFALAQVMRRGQQGVNTLAASAFIILLFDPYSLFAVGFQLSYAAVLGILLFYPLLKNTLEIESTILRWLWQITLVSLSAQVFTFPLSIYYFHQFPMYFWLVNPFIIALTTILLYCALVLLLSSTTSILPLITLVSSLTGWIADVMNQIVRFPQKLPKTTLVNLHLNFLDIILLSFIFLYVFKLLRYKEIRDLKVIGLLSMLFLLSSVSGTLIQFWTPRGLIHASSKHTAITFTEGQKAYVLCDSAFAHDTLANAYALKNYLNTQEITEIIYYPLFNKTAGSPVLVKWHDKTLAIDTRFKGSQATISLIRSRKYPRGLPANWNPGQPVVLSQELGYKTKAEWKRILADSNRPYHDLAEQGAMEL